MNLKDAKMCSTVKVTEICAKGELKRRLLDLGIIEGTNIEVLYKGAFGDPVAYLIRGAVIAIREEDGAKIKVVSCR
jgi:ferrous iron transport protein A